MHIRERRPGLAEVDGQGGQPQHVRGTEARALSRRDQWCAGCGARPASPCTGGSPTWWRSNWQSLVSTAGSSLCPHVAVTKRAAQEPCLQRQWPVLVLPSPPTESGGRTVSMGGLRKNQAIPQRAGSPVAMLHFCHIPTG